MMQSRTIKGVTTHNISSIGPMSHNTLSGWIPTFIRSSIFLSLDMLRRCHQEYYIGQVRCTTLFNDNRKTTIFPPNCSFPCCQITTGMHESIHYFKTLQIPRRIELPLKSLKERGIKPWVWSFYDAPLYLRDRLFVVYHAYFESWVKFLGHVHLTSQRI